MSFKFLVATTLMFFVSINVSVSQKKSFNKSQVVEASADEVWEHSTKLNYQSISSITSAGISAKGLTNNLSFSLQPAFYYTLAY